MPAKPMLQSLLQALCQAPVRDNYKSFYLESENADWNSQVIGPNVGRLSRVEKQPSMVGGDCSRSEAVD